MSQPNFRCVENIETSNDSVSLGEVVSISKQKRSEILAKAARRMRERGSDLSDGKIYK